MCRKRKRGFDLIVNISESFQKNKKRILTGTATAAVILFALSSGGFILAAVVAVFVLFCMREYVQILNYKGFQPSFRIIFVTSFILFLITIAHLYMLFPIVLFLGTMLAFSAVLFKLRQPYIANVATTVFGFILCWLPCHVYLLRGIGAPGKGFLSLWEMNPGFGYILFMFFVIAATDVGAYFFGTKFGKTQLAPDVSPKKTVEGAVAGGVCAIVTGLIIGAIIGLSFIESFAAALLITFFAQIGDLSESLIKRDAGVKDSGDSLPGHGGFLDRADSYILAAPVAFYIFKYFIYDGGAASDIFIQISRVLTDGGFL